MTSAFDAKACLNNDNADMKTHFGGPRYPPSESETEDEEVRMNCAGGIRGVDDSDMNSTTDHSEDVDSEDEGDR